MQHLEFAAFLAARGLKRWTPGGWIRTYKDSSVSEYRQAAKVYRYIVPNVRNIDCDKVPNVRNILFETMDAWRMESDGLPDIVSGSCKFETMDAWRMDSDKPFS